MDPCRKRILVVEDDAEMRSLLKDFMEQEGIEADSVEDGSQAFRKLAREKFDLVVTDIRMPGLSGLDILPGLKQIQPNIAVIAITAFGSEEVRSRALEKGADGYLEKPLQLEELKKLIHQMILTKSKA
jgi:DNA-binding response OmpR family regulator